MKNLKEIVDDYLTKHFTEIQQKRKNKNFKWSDIAFSIAIDQNYSDFFTKDGKLLLNPEYVRMRFRVLRKQEPTALAFTDFNVSKKSISKKELGEQTKKEIENLSSTASNKFRYISGAENKDKGTKEFIFSADNIPTEEEIISHFNIDLTKYKISQIWHKTTPSGKYSISVNLQVLKGLESQNYEQKFEKFLEKYNNTILQNPSKDKKPFEFQEENEEVCFIVSLADLHIGNYQKDNYLELIKEKVFYVIDSAKNFNVEEVIILNTGDLLHSDTSKTQTWNNTQLDAQDSFEDAFTNGLDFISSIIDYSRQSRVKTTFINVRGNHSFDTEYCLGEALKKVYKTDNKVKILNSKDSRIYYSWRNNGFLFAYGDKAVDRLPLLFATEGKETFSSTEHHSIILGHLHHNRGKQFINDRGEFAGIEVRVLGSPTSNDIWHKQNGFCQNKKAIQCMAFSPNQGKYAEFNFKL